MLKAQPVVEAGQRCIYIEASNESLDYQNEIVQRKALEESADYFLRYGNLDIDHITQIGAKAGIPNYEMFEIGRPTDVRFEGNKTYVKGEIYSGDGPSVERANHFWDSITNSVPAQRWYPSVGGQVLQRKPVIGADVVKQNLVTKVRWTNIGFSKTPVNLSVPEVSTVPYGILAKCWTVHGLDLEKALEAGYGTDSAMLAGGAALRRQSLHGALANYFEFRDALAERMLAQRVKDTSAEGLTQFSVDEWGVPSDTAAEWVTKFLHDLKSGMRRYQ